jgi:hypothetical protein
MHMTEADELLTFFKAMADENRLRIVGLLAQQSYTVEGIAEILGLSPSTVSHHLSRLADAGLVSATARSYYNDYHLNRERLMDMSQRMNAPIHLSGAAGDPGETSYDRKVLRSYLLPNGRLKDIPAQQKKLLVILRHVVKAFQPGRRYSEREVNTTLEVYHPDPARLRRELVSAGWMEREANGQAYWLADRAAEPPPTGSHP